VSPAHFSEIITHEADRNGAQIVARSGGGNMVKQAFPQLVPQGRVRRRLKPCATRNAQDVIASNV